jgi:hypothetical protein
METHVMTARITTTFEEWSAVYDGSLPAQQAAGITSLYRGVSKDDPNLICAVLQAAPGALESFMAANAEMVAASGHILETTVDQVFLSGS